jgi:hypothetical protein
MDQHKLGKQMPFHEPKIQYTHTHVFNFLYIIISEDLNLCKVHYIPVSVHKPLYQNIIYLFVVIFIQSS